MFKLIEAEKANHPISLLCRVLKVSRSGYYDWKNRSTSKRVKEDAALTVKICEIHRRKHRDLQLPSGTRRTESPGCALLQ